jgi:hypothetical protein
MHTVAVNLWNRGAESIETEGVGEASPFHRQNGAFSGGTGRKSRN